MRAVELRWKTVDSNSITVENIPNNAIVYATDNNGKMIGYVAYWDQKFGVIVNSFSCYSPRFNTIEELIENCQDFQFKCLTDDNRTLDVLTFKDTDDIIYVDESSSFNHILLFKNNKLLDSYYNTGNNSYMSVSESIDKRIREVMNFAKKLNCQVYTLLP